MSDIKNYDLAWPGINQCLHFMDKRMESGLISPESLELIKECLEMTKAKVETMLSKIDDVKTIDDINAITFTEWRREIFLRTSIRNLELSVRSYNALDTAYIKTLSQLVKHKESDLLRLPNLGRTSLNEIKERLSTLDLTLNMDV